MNIAKPHANQTVGLADQVRGPVPNMRSLAPTHDIIGPGDQKVILGSLVTGCCCLRRLAISSLINKGLKVELGTTNRNTHRVAV